MKKLILIATFFLICSNLYAVNILSASFSPLKREILFLVDIDGLKNTATISLEDCGEPLQDVRLQKAKNVPKGYIDASVKSGEFSYFHPNILYASGDKFYIYDIQNKRELQAFDSFIRTPAIIKEADNGKFVAASDGISFSVYQFKQNKLEELFSKDLEDRITAIYPDVENKVIYVASASGAISEWSFTGKLIKNGNSGIVIHRFTYDVQNGNLLSVANKGLYVLDRSSLKATQLLNGKVYDISLDTISNTLEVINEKGLIVYSYPVLKPILTVASGLGKVLRKEGAKLYGIVKPTGVHIYEAKGMPIVTVSLDNSLKPAFYPPEYNYGGNITASFIEAAAKARGKESKFDYNKVCTPLIALISGVHIPESLRLNAVNLPDSVEVDGVSVPRVAGAALPKNVEVKSKAFMPLDPNAPKGAFLPKDANGPKNPKEPEKLVLLDNAKKPVTPNVDKLLSTNVPNWVANRKNLPKNEDVGSSANYDEAVLKARSGVKNKLMRDLLTFLVQNKAGSEIKNVEVRKRFLWQSSAAALNAAPIKVVDKWASQTNTHYVHSRLETKGLKENALNNAKSELEKYEKLGDEAYMKEKVLKTD